MASFTTLFFFSLLFIITISTTTSSAINTAVKTTQESPQQLQFNTIIDSIVGAGDFRNWANLLSQADPSFFPLSATIFIPDDTAFVKGNLSSPSSSAVKFIDPLLFPYHVIPRRFSFNDLRQFPVGARFPTALPGNTLLITNNSADNFTIDGSKITRSDLFLNAAVSVHGIGDLLDYTLFGRDDNDITGYDNNNNNNNNNDNDNHINNNYNDDKALISSPEMSAEQDLILGPAPSMLPMEFRQKEIGPVPVVGIIQKSETLGVVDGLSLIRGLLQYIATLVVTILNMYFVYL